MMAVVRYCTPEWLEESSKIYRADPAVQKALEKVTVKFFFRVRADPSWGIDPDILFGTVVEKGALLDLSFHSEAAAKEKADFIAAATVQEWKKVLRKDAKVLTELMLRKIVLEQGSMTEALPLMPHAPTLVDVLTKAELRFPDEMGPEELERYRKDVQAFRARLGV
jgi:hypothetical protein